MKVLVTGASGFLGRYVLSSLKRRGIPTVAISRSSHATGAGQTLSLDLLAHTNLPATIEQIKATHLLHLAWYTEHGKYWSSPQNLRWVEASLRLVDAFCTAGGGHVVVAGTCAEYDWSHGWCREDATPLAPSTLYGVAKDALRRLVAPACELQGTRCAWGRVFFPYGMGESSPRLLPSLVEVFRNARPPFPVNAKAYRDFVHASDVAEAFVTLLLTDARGPYNIGSGTPTQVETLVREVANALGADPLPMLELAKMRNEEPPILVGDNRRLLSLGWRPSLSLAEGIAQTIRPDQPAAPNRRVRE